MRTLSRVVLPALLFLAVSGPAQAQSDAPVGVRAAGMAGAFVAVADDASAVFWNPAGLAAGSYFSLVIDRNAFETGDEPALPRSRSGSLIALGTPPLGIGYYRTRTTTVVENPVPASHTSFILQSLTTHHAGVTLVQTLAGTIAIGATLKVVHGEASAVAATAPATIEAAGDVPSHGSTKFDADFGVMASSKVVKLGLTVRNLFEPEFETAGGAVAAITLERRIRAGVAVSASPILTIAGDYDFTKTSTSGGKWRDAAAGLEARMSRRAAARAGIHWNTAGDEANGAAPIASVGGSYLLVKSIIIDGQVSFGSGNGDRGWGIGARIVY
jgi:hypothetical protein